MVLGERTSGLFVAESVFCVLLQPASIHGVFWLQCHFPDSEWDALLSGQAVFEVSCMKQLAQDARLAGVSLDWATSVAS